MAKKKTAVQIMNEDMEQMDADVKSMIEEAEAGEQDGGQQPAAQDRTAETDSDLTAAKAGKERAAGAAAPGQEGLPGEGDGTPPPEAKTPSERPTARNTANSGDGGERPADSETAGAEASHPEKRDWVKEAYECFVKDAKDIDPTDPVKAIEFYFEKNATDELKARCKAEGKDAEGCWKFIEAVAHKALGSSGGHIDPAVVYAIAMHWFEDVPKDWDVRGRSPATPKAAKPAKAAKPKKPAETPSEVKKEKAKANAAKKRKSKTQQGFFFEMLETPVEGGTEK